MSEEYGEYLRAFATKLCQGNSDIKMEKKNATDRYWCASILGIADASWPGPDPRSALQVAIKIDEMLNSAEANKK